MLLADTGIVFHHIDYSETSVIVKIYTKENGLVSLVLKGAKRKSKKGSTAAFQPLSLVSAEYYYSDNKDLHTAKTVGILKPYKTLHTDIFKSSVLLFVNEILFKTIQHPEKNIELFEFIETFLVEMDEATFNANSHLWFLCHLAHYLGIMPDVDGFKLGLVLDLLDGDFKYNAGRAGDSSPETAEIIYKLLGMKFVALDDLKITSDQRRSTLQTLVDYYQIQLEDIKSINSHLVLKELLE